MLMYAVRRLLRLLLVDVPCALLAALMVLGLLSFVAAIRWLGLEDGTEAVLHTPGRSKASRAAACTAAALMLTACGGSYDEADPPVNRQPVDCTAQRCV